MKVLKLKKIPVFFFLAALPLSGYSQQEEYTAFLEHALEAALNKDEKTFHTNLRYFSTAIERDQITPELLTEKNFKLYSKNLYNAIVNKFKFSQDLGEKAFEFLNYKTEEYPDNMASLGYLYALGIGVEQDYFIAKNWFEKAALKGQKVAMYNLGLLYINGWGVESSDQKAFEWFEKSAFIEYPDAMYNLGVLYSFGRGTERDLSAAFYWYKKAAETGMASAMFNLAYCYYYGDGVPRNYALAKHWLEKNLEKEENPPAMGMLAFIYRNGLETPKDLDKALSLYSQACGLGDNESCEEYDRYKK